MKWDNQLINHLQWSNTIINRKSKEIVAQEIAAIAKDGDVIGAGSRFYRLSDAIRISGTYSQRISTHRSYPCLCRNFHDLYTIGYTTNDPLE